MKIKNIIEEMERLAPLELAEDWDNVGLIVGNDEEETNNVIICLDINQKVLDDCLIKNAKLCICHHPYIFDSFSKMNYKDPYFKILSEFIKNDIAIYAAHTNLDSCIGGVNDALVNALGYAVTGTFEPNEKFRDLKKAPIEHGLGRVVEFITPKSLFEIYKNSINKLGVNAATVNFDKNSQILKLLVASGSYQNEWNEKVIAQGIDLIITGEMKHNDLIVMQRSNVNVIAAGHDATERVILQPLCDYLNKLKRNVEFDVSINLDYNILSSE